jgi:hypothetical protein
VNIHFRSILAVVVAMALPMTVQAAQQAPAPLPDVTSAVRDAYEHALGNQPELQRLALMMNQHQMRMLQISAQLEGMRRDLIGAGVYRATLERLFTETRAREANAPTVRAQEEAAALRRMFEPQLESAIQLEADLRAREHTLDDQLTTEGARWMELAERLAGIVAR